MSEDANTLPKNATVQVVSKPNTFTVTDELGRTLQYKPLNPAEKGKLMLALGDHASNQMYFGYVAMACGVRMIGDVPTMLPKDLKTAEDFLILVGDEGLDAIGEVLAEQQANQAKLKEQAKNSQANQT